MNLRRYILLLFILFGGLVAFAQAEPEGYNPFVPVNLDDTLKLPIAQVVESSYHYYWIKGDPNYTDTSTFVWYVQNGEFGLYDSLTDVWTPLPVTALGTGYVLELKSETIDSVHNCSDVWVRWNPDAGDGTGYVAVYERSNDGCIEPDQISGFKNEIVNAPEIWFITSAMDVCSDDPYSVTIKMNNITAYSYPYRFKVRYPGNDGVMLDSTFWIKDGDLDELLSYTFELPAVSDRDVTTDELYNITLVDGGLRDKYGATGLIAPLGLPMGQFASIRLIINHLPQTQLMAADGNPANTPLPGLLPVVIPDPGWALDSVVNGSVHLYTVQGDTNYVNSSRFVWTVYGGTLYADAAGTVMVGNGTTDTLQGNASNITTLYVGWDKFTTARDTGYVYVYEISDDGCQRSNDDPDKYRGMRIKVSAPPDARFLADETILCSYGDSACIIAQIKGMPPYDLYYSLSVNGGDETHLSMHITAADLSDLDGDGEVDNIAFCHSGFTDIEEDQTYSYILDSVSSGGVKGTIQSFGSHLLYVRALPPAPQIDSTYRREILAGLPYTYELYYEGKDPNEWTWTVRDEATNVVEGPTSTTTSSDYSVTLNSSPGTYYFSVYYTDGFGCVSPTETVPVELYGIPTIEFLDNDTIINCSASSWDTNEIFKFRVKYSGARTYSYRWVLYDPDGNIVKSDNLDQQTNWETEIDIVNDMINDSDTIKPWRLVITNAVTDFESYDVNILDSDIPGGRDERIILIHPKPLIQDDIDFAN